MLRQLSAQLIDGDLSRVDPADRHAPLASVGHLLAAVHRYFSGNLDAEITFLYLLIIVYVLVLSAKTWQMFLITSSIMLTASIFAGTHTFPALAMLSYDYVRLVGRALIIIDSVVGFCFNHFFIVSWIVFWVCIIYRYRCQVGTVLQRVLDNRIDKMTRNMTNEQVIIGSITRGNSIGMDYRNGGFAFSTIVHSAHDQWSDQRVWLTDLIFRDLFFDQLPYSMYLDFADLELEMRRSLWRRLCARKLVNEKTAQLKADVQVRGGQSAMRLLVVITNHFCFDNLELEFFRFKHQLNGIENLNSKLVHDRLNALRVQVNNPPFTPAENLNLIRSIDRLMENPHLFAAYPLSESNSFHL